MVLSPAPLPPHAQDTYPQRVIQPDLPLSGAAHSHRAKVQHFLGALNVLVLWTFVLYAYPQVGTFAWGREKGVSGRNPPGPLWVSDVNSPSKKVGVPRETHP